MNDSIPKSIRLTKRHLEMINELQIRWGYRNVTDTLVASLIDHYRSSFPAYLVGKTNKDTRTPEQIARDVVALKRAKESAEQEEKERGKREIVEQVLRGQVIEENGVKYAVYKNFDRFTDYEQKLPLSMISLQLADNQFIPSREAVFLKRPELAEMFGETIEDKVRE